MLPILFNHDLLFGPNKSNNSKVFERLLEPFGDIFSEPFSDNRNILPLDIRDTGSSYQINVDTPGINKEDIKINLDGRNLIVQGQRKSEHSETKNGYHRAERWYGSFNRSIRLPNDANLEDLHATLNNGVLSLEVKKYVAEKSSTRQIEIQ